LHRIELKPNLVVRGSILPEPIKVIATVPMGDSLKLIGEGLNPGKVVHLEHLFS
jgi:hypothetical protein